MNTIKHAFLWFFDHKEVPLILGWVGIVAYFAYTIGIVKFQILKTLQEFQFYFFSATLIIALLGIAIISMFFKYVDRVGILTNQIKKIQQGGK